MNTADDNLSGRIAPPPPSIRLYWVLWLSGLANDFADTGSMLSCNRFQATILHEITKVIQRVVIRGQIVIAA